MQTFFDYLNSNIVFSGSVWVFIAIFIIGGIALLKSSADWFVSGAANLGIRLGMSSVLVGLTIVAFGTSAPELVVSIVTALKGRPQICLGNVIGSNSVNVGLALGLAVLIFPFRAKKKSAFIDSPLSLASILLVIVLAWLPFSQPSISRIDGAILLIVFAIWMIQITRTNLKKKTVELSGALIESSVAIPAPAPEDADDEIFFHKRHIAVDILLLIGGLIALVLSADALVAGGVKAAQLVGVSDTVIGLTIIAIGTSLPEIAVSIAAALKGQTDIALGNVLGSNIFNALLILGAATVIQPINFLMESDAKTNDTGVMYIDIPFCAGLSLVLAVLMLMGRDMKRWKGGLIAGSYIVYLAWLIVRNA
ncbi:MAG: calcium/sodium antiporter [Planctomycetota bacterium]